MKGRDFFDTNILVYAFDTKDPRKQTIASNLLNQAIINESGILSTQVMSEFYTVVTRIIKKPLSPQEALGLIDNLAVLPVQEVDLDMVKRAIRISDRYTISYWDSLIIAAAERGECKRLISEDLNNGQIYYDIVVYDPFG